MGPTFAQDIYHDLTGIHVSRKPAEADQVIADIRKWVAEGEAILSGDTVVPFEGKVG